MSAGTAVFLFIKGGWVLFTTKTCYRRFLSRAFREGRMFYGHVSHFEAESEKENERNQVENFKTEDQSLHTLKL